MDITVSFISGTVKKVVNHDWLKTVGAGGIWESAASQIISSGYTLKLDEILVLQDNQELDITLETPSTETDKGLYVPVGFDHIEVVNASGKVRHLAYDKQTFASTIDNISSDPAMQLLSIGDVVYGGDLISLDDSSLVTLRFSLGDDSKYIKTGFNIVALSNA
jgi:hypothetical protein